MVWSGMAKDQSVVADVARSSRPLCAVVMLGSCCCVTSPSPSAQHMCVISTASPGTQHYVTRLLSGTNGPPLTHTTLGPWSYHRYKHKCKKNILKLQF